MLIQLLNYLINEIFNLFTLHQLFLSINEYIFHLQNNVNYFVLVEIFKFLITY